MRLFTPRKSDRSDERYRMQLNAEDAAKTGRGRPWRAEVTDQLTGRRYSVKGAACAADCFCDAVVTYEHPLADKCTVEITAAGAVRLILFEEDLDPRYGFTVKDIVEWDHANNPDAIGRMMARHCADRCGDDYTITIPDDLVLSARIKNPATKFARIIEHKKVAA